MLKKSSEANDMKALNSFDIDLISGSLSFSEPDEREM